MIKKYYIYIVSSDSIIIPPFLSYNNYMSDLDRNKLFFFLNKHCCLVCKSCSNNAIVFNLKTKMVSFHYQQLILIHHIHSCISYEMNGTCTFTSILLKDSISTLTYSTNITNTLFDYLSIDIWIITCPDTIGYSFTNRIGDKL